jgi:hypothetical protein
VPLAHPRLPLSAKRALSQDSPGEGAPPRRLRFRGAARGIECTDRQEGAVWTHILAEQSTRPSSWPATDAAARPPTGRASVDGRRSEDSERRAVRSLAVLAVVAVG